MLNFCPVKFLCTGLDLDPKSGTLKYFPFR